LVTAKKRQFPSSTIQAFLAESAWSSCSVELKMSALNLLGIRYAKGRGVKKNPRLAMRFFLRSAIQGYTPARANLGTRYEIGATGHADFRRAYAWVRAALSFGVPEKDHDDTVLKLWVIAQRLDPGRIESAERLADVIGIEIVERCKCFPGQEPELASNWELSMVSAHEAPVVLETLEKTAPSIDVQDALRRLVKWE
jgi:hypothetical protein